MIGEPVMLVKIVSLLKHNTSSPLIIEPAGLVQFVPARPAPPSSAGNMASPSTAFALASPPYPQCPAPVA